MVSETGYSASYRRRNHDLHEHRKTEYHTIKSGMYDSPLLPDQDVIGDIGGI